MSEASKASPMSEANKASTKSEAAKVITACGLVIGNEVLSGRTRDANVQMLASGLGKVGVRLTEVRIITDHIPTIVATVNAVRAAHDYVFSTGGIGPTHDDMTTAAMAQAFGVAVERNPDAVARLVRHYQSSDLSAARLKMADIPVGATLIDNPVSGAPGFRLGNVFVMAGIPRIAEAMFAGVVHTLVGGDPVLSRAVTAWMGESFLAADLGEIQSRHPESDIGSYPFVRDGHFGTTVIARGVDASQLDRIIADVAAAMTGLGHAPEFFDHSAG